MDRSEAPRPGTKSYRFGDWTISLRRSKDTLPLIPWYSSVAAICVCVGVEGLCVGLHARGVEDDDDDQEKPNGTEPENGKQKTKIGN